MWRSKGSRLWVEEEGAFQADARPYSWVCAFRELEKDNVFWPRGQRGVDVCVVKLSSSFSCNIPSCLSSLAFIHPFIHFQKESTDEFHYPMAGTMLVRIQQWICPQTLVPKMSQEKEKDAWVLWGHRGSFHLCHELPGWGWEEREFKPKKTYVHRFRGKGDSSRRQRNLENSGRLPE